MTRLSIGSDYGTFLPADHRVRHIVRPDPRKRGSSRVGGTGAQHNPVFFVPVADPLDAVRLPKPALKATVSLVMAGGICRRALGTGPQLGGIALPGCHQPGEDRPVRSNLVSVIADVGDQRVSLANRLELGSSGTGATSGRQNARQRPSREPPEAIAPPNDQKGRGAKRIDQLARGQQTSALTTTPSTLVASTPTADHEHADAPPFGALRRVIAVRGTERALCAV
jgi:hypothetical protein